ncbi:CHRD domain-containing protein [Hymenobacter latericus]|uniref:CHRD domain-containing protein n=1 Tax=Hymenobacter sp. YIM 151858-1 TaxID=2987688 RepID=UPI002226277B|nr:CHRD domain-containing protein [Hymenobacter sp. YIM 151858-1]UYZ61230.1 CHRD domain-containing protein [Hymenobacter sp. YIM 151858-1]
MKTRLFSQLAALLCTGLLLTGCQQEAVEPRAEVLTQTADAKGQSRSYTAHLSGDEEVPAVPTNATGQAIFHLSKDGTSIRYKLIVANISSVRFGHLHLAPRGANGPVVVNLVGRTEPSPQGVIAEGVITSASLRGPLLGQPISALLAAIEAGNIYTNVHSDEYPGGEIRGQVR